MPSAPRDPRTVAKWRSVYDACLAEGFAAPENRGGGRGSAIKEAARRLQVNHATLLSALRAQERSSPQVPAEARRIVGLEDEVAKLRAEIKRIHRSELTAERISQEIFGITRKPVVRPKWLVSPSKAANRQSVPLTNWSDWHFGEVISRREVAGVNEFNVAIAEKRIQRLVERTIDLCFNHMVNPDYPGIVVCLGGDLMTGSIHDELAQTNERTDTQCVVDLVGHLAWALAQMADRFGKVYVPCVVGNHGRNTLKPRAKGRTHTSYEWLIYRMLEMHLRSDARIQFEIPDESDVHFQVFGRRYMLTHGDALGVKGGDGIIGSLGPIMRGRIKTHTSETQIGRDFDTLLIGHWHTYLPLPGLIVNGSLKGYDEYARLYLRARYQPPIQALTFVHPKWGETAHWAVRCDEASANDDSKPWAPWRAAG